MHERRFGRLTQISNYEDRFLYLRWNNARLEHICLQKLNVTLRNSGTEIDQISVVPAVWMVYESLQAHPGQ